MNERAREGRILSIAAAAHFLTHFAMLLFPSLALAMRGEFGLPYDRVIALSFWMYLLYGLGALPFGILTDLWQRPRLMLLICLAGIGGCAAWAAVSRGPDDLRIALTGLGLFAAIYHPAGLAWISRDIRRRGWAMGLNGMVGNLGVVAAPLAAGLLTVGFGWRGAYWALAIPALAAAILAACLGGTRSVPEDAGRPAPGAGDGSGKPAWNRRTRLVAFGLLAMAMMMAGLAYRGQTLAMPAWFQQQGPILPESWLARLSVLEPAGAERGLLAATLLTSLAYLAGAWGQVVGGRWSDRYDLRGVYFLCHLLSVPLLLLLARLSGLPLLAAAMAYAFFAFGMQPAENSLVAELTPPGLRSTGYGLKFVMTFGVGALAVRMVAHWERTGGLEAVFPGLAAISGGLLGFVILLWLATRGRAIRN